MSLRFIWQDPGWPRMTWEDRQISRALAATRHRQGLLVGRLSALGVELRSEAELVALTSEVLQTSAIEGEVLSPEEVRSSIARKLGLPVAGLVESGREVEGIVEMTLDATRRFSDPVTEDRIFGWHSALFPGGRSGMRKLRVGQWRDDRGGPMQVVSGPLGNERVHFEAPPATRVAAEMGRFLAWANADDGIDPVLRAGLAHLWFVTIHPFEDGNGRVARAIAELLLARSDGRRERFYSMSAQIETEKKEYYRRLELSQRGGVDVTSWLEWFLDCLQRAFAGAEKALDGVLHKAWVWDRANAFGLNERQRTVLTRLLDGWKGHLTTSKYAGIARCSPDTALRDIRRLMEAGVLRQNPAGGRSVSYRIAERA